MLALALSARTKGNGIFAGKSWSGAETGTVCLLAFTRNEFTLREEVTQEYITRDNGETLTLTVGTASITMSQKKLQPEGIAHGVQFRCSLLSIICRIYTH